MYIERCKHGSEGGLYKPTIEIWQGGIFLPYSYATLCKLEGWQQHSYVSLCGVAEHAMLRRLELHPQISEVYLCLDNDNAGHSAAKRITARLDELDGYSVHRLCPQYKDWNDDLKKEIEQQEAFEQKPEGGMSLAL